MAKPPKLDRKSLREPDEFVKTGRSFFDVFVQQRSRFLAVVLVAIVLVGGVYAFEWIQKRQLHAAWAEFDEIQELKEDERWPKLETYHADNSSNRPGVLAALQLGDKFYLDARKQIDEGKSGEEGAKQAIDWYQKAVQYSDLVSIERQLLLVNLSKAYELAKQVDMALEYIDKAVAIDGEAKPLAMLNRGRLLELKGEKDAAVETYQKLAEQYLDTEYARLAKNYLRAIQSEHFKAAKSG